MHIGLALRKIRELRNLPMKFVAYKIGVGTEALSHLERKSRMPRVETISRIAKIMKTSVTAIVLHGLDENEIPAEHLENFQKLKQDIL